MRQPISIYSRSAARQGRAFMGRVSGKLSKMASGQPPKTQPQRRPKISLDDISSALDQLDIGSGDRIIVHSGISNIGKVIGGGSKLVPLIRDKIGAGGVALFPVFPFGTLMHTYLESGPSFDVRTAPTKMGALTQVALGDSDGVRSIHPTHSVLALGDDAVAFVSDHHRDPTPFGSNSPFWKLADSGGKIVVMGVGLSSVTGFHVTEDRMGAEFPVRVYLDKHYTVDCIDASGKTVQVKTSCHDPFISRVRDCYIFEQPFLAAGVYRKIDVGNHYVGVIDAAAMDRTLQEMARKDRLTIYGRVWG